jgi:RNA polymerase sigma factor (sigma-70 family)
MSNKKSELDKKPFPNTKPMTPRKRFASSHLSLSRSQCSLPTPFSGLTKSRQYQQKLSHQFWEEWLAHREYLVKLAMRWTSSNMADAEDAVSKVALKAHDHYLRDSLAIRNMRAWLARLLHNQCMDEHRKTTVRRNIFSRLTPEQYESTAICAAPPLKQDNAAGQAQPAAKALATIMEMPPRLRYPFVLRFVYEYSNSEIAEQLELTEVNVRKRIQLGRTLVRNRLEKDLN